jgi:hypothetical protein
MKSLSQEVAKTSKQLLGAQKTSHSTSCKHCSRHQHGQPVQQSAPRSPACPCGPHEPASPSCPCCPTDPACPCPGGCAYCSVAKVPCLTCLVPTADQAGFVDRCLPDAAFLYVAPSSGPPLRPPR